MLEGNRLKDGSISTDGRKFTFLSQGPARARPPTDNSLLEFAMSLCPLYFFTLFTLAILHFNSHAQAVIAGSELPVDIRLLLPRFGGFKVAPAGISSYSK